MYEGKFCSKLIAFNPTSLIIYYFYLLASGKIFDKHPHGFHVKAAARAAAGYILLNRCYTG